MTRSRKYALLCEVAIQAGNPYITRTVTGPVVGDDESQALVADDETYAVMVADDESSPALVADDLGDTLE